MSSAVSRSAKAESATKGGGGSKPNAWSKPLQPTKTSSSAKRFTNSNKPPGPNAPPGLTTPTGAASTSNGTGTVHRFHNNDNNGSNNNEESNAIALRERFLHLLLTVTGQSVTVSLKSGATYTGVLHTATPFAHLPEGQRFKYVLKAVTSSPLDASVEGKTLLLNMKEVVQLQIKSCRLDSLVVPAKGASNSDGAFTDTEISGAAGAAVMSRGKDLVSAGSHWTSEPIASSGAAAATTSTLKTNSRAGALKGNIADWDQFKANEELFNVTANYDETVYTTALDHSNISRQDQLRAAELARAIESSATTNMHLAEERGHVLSQDYDEEDRYSGVLKSNTAATAAIAPVPTKPTTTVTATKLNYAAVAKTRPPGFGGDNNNKAAATAKIEPKGESFAPKEKVEETSPPVPSEPVPTAITKETETKEELSPSPSAIPATSSAEEQAKKEQVPSTSTPEAKAEGGEKIQQESPKTKLNVNAKEFSFNINAKTFTPGMPSGMIPPPPPPQPQYIDPNTGYPMMPMHMPHGMMQVMMGHPGAFPGMRYPQYPGMEQMQHMPQHQHMHGPPAPQLLPVSSASPSAATSGATSPAPISDEGSISQHPVPQPQDADAASETSSQAASQQHPPQPSPPPPPPPPQHVHQMPMYMQQGYYPGGQIMHPGHLPQQFMHPAQLAAMQHQQRQMGYPIQPGHMPPNMMRAPNGMPYYAGPGGPMPYPPQYTGPYGEDPNLDGGMNAYGGRGGRGGMSGRLGRGGARQGRGPRSMGRVSGGGRVGIGGRLYQQQQQPSGGYSSSNNSSQPGSGRQTPQQQPHPPQPGYEHPPPASQPPQHETDPPVPEAPAVEE